MLPQKALAFAITTLGVSGVGIWGTSKYLSASSIEDKIKEEKLEEKLLKSSEEWKKVINPDTPSTETGEPSRTQRLQEFIKRHSENPSQETSVTEENLQKACQSAKPKPATEAEWKDFKDFCIKAQE